MGLRRGSSGFSLIELIAVMVIVGVVSVTATSRMAPTATFQLQASRDKVLAAFFIAQQRAMSQSASVQLVARASEVDILVDTDGDGSFADETSFYLDENAFPIELDSNQSFTAGTGTFTFNRLGYTSPGTLTLTQDTRTVDINVSSTGYAY